MIGLFAQTDDEKRTWMLHSHGKAPSQIDEAMDFEPGTARAIISDIWARDQEAQRIEKRERRNAI